MGFRRSAVPPHPPFKVGIQLTTKYLGSSALFRCSVWNWKYSLIHKGILEDCPRVCGWGAVEVEADSETSLSGSRDFLSAAERDRTGWITPSGRTLDALFRMIIIITATVAPSSHQVTLRFFHRPMSTTDGRKLLVLICSSASLD